MEYIRIGSGYLIAKWGKNTYILTRTKAILSNYFYYDYSKNIAVMEDRLYNNKTTQKLLKRYFLKNNIITEV